MSIVDALGIAAFLFVVYAEVVWVGLAFDERRDLTRRAARHRP